ncbi:MAG TPA: Lrp/AsnC family transcriptional regulator [Spirochaetota bacterium]|nr:Lrp/AsnC family transcriptional regulator [Spirochaetota bacterium]
MIAFSSEESLVLNAIQKSIPCSRKPFDDLSFSIGIPSTEILSILRDLKEKKIVRNISGIFSGENLGFVLSLVAFKVPPHRIDHAASIISSHPGVSHNYLRNHDYNIWFTLAEEDEASFKKAVEIIAAKSFVEDYLILKNEKLLKIGVFLDIADSGETLTFENLSEKQFRKLSDIEKEAVRLLQIDMPLTEYPFDEIVKGSNIIKSPDELLSHFSSFLEKGIMRRYAAVLRHHKAGFSANAMTAWKIDEKFDEDIFKSCPDISHLYYRTTYPGRWEYPLFAMIHARTREELFSVIADLSHRSGIRDYLVLESLKEFKKSRVKYFSQDFINWKRINYD